MKSVLNHTGASVRRHEPSDSRLARILAPSPSRGMRARSAAIATGEASVRSRMACQLMAGSESSSQSIVSMRVSMRGFMRDSCWSLCRDISLSIFHRSTSIHIPKGP